jgi:hypothetical protein
VLVPTGISAVEKSLIGGTLQEMLGNLTPRLPVFVYAVRRANLDGATKVLVLKKWIIH